MFGTSRIASVMIDAFTAQPSQSRNSRAIMGRAVRALLGCIVLLTILLGAANATAQNTGYFSSLDTFTVQTVGSPVGAGTALDRSGNLYVADTGLNIVYEIQAINGAISASSSAVTLTGPWTAPYAVAVDAGGNVYVADNGSPYAVYKYVPASGSTPSSVTTLYSTSTANHNLVGVAVDQSGNVYAADKTKGKILVLPAGSSTPITLASGFPALSAIAVDASGNLIAADNNGASTSSIYEAPASSIAPLIAGTITTPLIPSGLTLLPAPTGNYSSNTGIAVDGFGDVFVSDQNGLYEIVAANGAVSGSSHVNLISDIGQWTMGHGLVGNLSINNSGEIYATDNFGGTVYHMSTQVVNFGSSPVNTATSYKKLSFIASVGFSNYDHSRVLTQGATGKDFADIGTGSCEQSKGQGTYGCTVHVTFTPKAIGLRTGILELLDSSNNLLGSIQLSGIGTGGMATVDPAPVTAYTVTDGQNGDATKTTFVSPMAVAVDAAGDIFVVDNQQGNHPGQYGALYEIPAGSTTATYKTGAFNAPAGLAFDAAGNLYLADAPVVGSQVVVFPNGATDGSFKFGTNPMYKTVINTAAPLFAGKAIQQARGVAVGPDGTVYVSDLVVGSVDQSRVVSYNPSTGATGIAATGLNWPSGLAVDAAGSLYVADSLNAKVYKYTNGALVQTLDVGGYPAGVAIEPSGSLLVSDMSSSHILRIPNKNGTLVLADAVNIETNPTVTAGVEPDSAGIALDKAGNLFVAALRDARVNVYARTSAAIDFGSTGAGSSSAVVPIYVENAGNTDVTLANPALSPAIQTPFSLTPSASNGCTDGDTGKSGGVCSYDAQYSPTTGTTGVQTASTTLSATDENSATLSAGIQLSGKAVLTTAVAMGTSPAGLSYTVDGVDETGTAQLLWEQDSFHAFSTTSPQNLAGVQYTFREWKMNGDKISDGLSLSGYPTPAGTTLFEANFYTSAYQLSYSSNNSDWGTVTADDGSNPVAAGTYLPGYSAVNLTAKPAIGYLFTGWTGTTNDLSNPASTIAVVTMNGVESLVANFIPATVPVTVDTNPTGLTFSVDGGSPLTAPQTFNWTPTDTHTITASTPLAVTSDGSPVAGEEYVFSSWSAGSSTLAGVNTYTVPPTAETVVALYTTEYSVTFSSPDTNKGTVSGIVNGSTVTSPAYLQTNDYLYLTATPATGYYTSDWLVNGGTTNSSGNSYSAQMGISPLTVQPVFSTIPYYVVNTNAEDGANAKASNCTAFTSAKATNTTDTACSLRDAILGAKAAGAANISFDTTVFKAGNTAAQNTIVLSNYLGLTGTINLTGPGAGILTIDGNNDPSLDDIFFVGENAQTTATISGMTIAHGVAPGGGGAIYNEYDGVLTVQNVVFDSNKATYDPEEEGDYFSSGNPAAALSGKAKSRAAARARALDTPSIYSVNGSSGGAIWNEGQLTVTGCTFTNNTAFSGQDETVADSGGAIFNKGQMAITESTFHNNSSDIGGAIDDESYGGIHKNPDGIIASAAKPNLKIKKGITLLAGVTFVNNKSTQLNSGAIAAINPGLTVYNSIFSGNTGGIYFAASPSAPPEPDHRANALASLDDSSIKVEGNVFYNNLGNEATPVEDDCTNCTSLSGSSADPKLLPLGSYGGTTPTMLPMPGSSAICLGYLPAPIEIYLQQIPTDQRGFPSTNTTYLDGGVCIDSGAVQTNYALAFAQGKYSGTIGLAVSPTPVVAVTESGNPFAGGAVTLTYSGAGALSNAGPVNSAATTGNATFSNFSVDTAGDGTLTASMPLWPANGEGDNSISAGYAIATADLTISAQTTVAPLVVVSANTLTTFLQNPVTLTATVSSPSGTPSGTVTFLNGTTSLGQGTLVNGVASLSVSTLTAGSHTITVSYAGDQKFLAGTSAPITEFVEDFTVTAAAGSATATVMPGGTAKFAFTVAPPAGTTFPAAIALSLNGFPAGSTYSLSPSTLPAGGGSTAVTLTVNVPQTTATANTASKLAPLTLALLLLPFFGRMRRASKRLRRVLPLLLLLGVSLAAAVGLTGCNSTSGFFGQQQKTYTVTVTGTSGNLSHSATVTLTVE